MTRDREQPPTLAELAALTADPWDCPRCGCQDWRTVNTYPCQDGTIHRRQRCRHCGHIRITYESPMPPAAESAANSIPEAPSLPPPKKVRKVKKPSKQRPQSLPGDA